VISDDESDGGGSGSGSGSSDEDHDGRHGESDEEDENEPIRLNRKTSDRELARLKASAPHACIGLHWVARAAPVLSAFD
jgi:hypothetical protein